MTLRLATLTAARITRGQRRVFLRLAQHWPWTLALTRAFRRTPDRHPHQDHGETGPRAGALSRPQAGQDHHAVLVLSPKAS